MRFMIDGLYRNQKFDESKYIPPDTKTEPEDSTIAMLFYGHIPICDIAI